MPLGALGSINLIRLLLYRPHRRLPFLGLVFGLGVAVTVWMLRDYISNVDAVGYSGVFFLSLLGSVAMVLPVPGLASVCGVSLILNPFLLGLLGGLGETLGEISGYAVGYGGAPMLERRKFYNRLQHWVERRGGVVLFLVSVIPNPIFDLVGIAAGAARYPLPRFFVVVLLGKIVKCLIVGYTCYYGLTLLPWSA